jgi:aminoglycoside phosphotransferase family enzyme/predicted kinase
MIVEDQGEVIAFLSRPGAFGSGVSRVDRVETHVSVVFLAGEQAYKLKRAVRFPYLDFSTRELRREFCEAEVRINRRTAPEIYRRVVAVNRKANGALGLGGGGQPVEWLVEMARFDEDTLFDRLAQRNVLDATVIENLGDVIARFHDKAERRLNAGGPAAIARIIDGNARSFADCPPGCCDSSRVKRLTETTRRALGSCIVLLGERSRAGFVRHCHGDLHLRNIFLDNGRPTLFDAIEFSAALADIDVLYDIAFLIMDLEYRDLRPLASILLNRYLDNTGDAGGLKALPLFLSLRAAIRSHVDAAAASSQSDPREAKKLREAAHRYLEMAIAFLLPHAPRLIAVGGLSGTGKSLVARELAPFLGGVPGARVVRTDSTRKRLAGVRLSARLGQDGYTPEMDKRTYQAALEEARVALAAGHSVIADAVFARPQERRAIAKVAEDCGVPFQGLWLETDPEVMQERVTGRRGDVSDATAEVVRAQLEYDLGPVDWPRLDAAGPVKQTVAQGVRLLGLEKA